MRGLVPGLTTPYPIASLLPAVFQEDPVTVALTEAFDDVIAPVIAALDCLHAYLDPLLAPTDFLEWLAGWVGAELNENWPLSRQRAVVAEAVRLHRMRGTVAGLRAYLEVATGGTVEITDSGGVTWSNAPDAALPGEPTPRLTVRVLLPEGVAVSASAIEALVTSAKPVHVAHEVIVGTTGAVPTNNAAP
jgi:phage tail-like protein